MTHQNRQLIINALLFQAGWFACVIGGNTIAVIATALILFIHLSYLTNWKKEREILAITLLLGSATDSFLSHLGILVFTGDSLLIPPWLACLWLLFGTTIRHCLAWTSRYKLAGMLTGAIAGPCSYYAGAQLSGVGLAKPLWQPLLTLTIIWSLMIPLLQAFSSIWLERYRKRYPLHSD